MREYLFRGQVNYDEKNPLKHEWNGRWIYGMLTKKGSPICYCIDNRPVDPKTIGEWTSKKDDYGQKIFEGDIVQCVDYPEYIGEVWWCNDDASFLVEPLTLEGLNAYISLKIKVIGNIHDNPELLKSLKSDNEKRFERRS